MMIDGGLCSSLLHPDNRNFGPVGAGHPDTNKPETKKFVPPEWESSDSSSEEESVEDEPQGVLDKFNSPSGKASQRRGGKMASPMSKKKMEVMV